MKKWMLILLVLLLLAGCAVAPESDVTFLSFYYPRREILYGAKDGVIACEQHQKEAFGETLEEILNGYLGGPVSEYLYNPFPAGSTVLHTFRRGNVVLIQFSGEFFQPEGLDATLAYAALAKTCFALTDAEELTLLSPLGEQRMTLTRESFVFSDEGDAIDMAVGPEA